MAEFRGDRVPWVHCWLSPAIFGSVVRKLLPNGALILVGAQDYERPPAGKGTDRLQVEAAELLGERSIGEGAVDKQSVRKAASRHSLH
jgi:hypothetical protein